MYSILFEFITEVVNENKNRHNAHLLQMHNKHFDIPKIDAIIPQ